MRVFKIMGFMVVLSLFSVDMMAKSVKDEVVTIEQVYKAYCSPKEFRALAKKVRDGAGFIPFVEKDLLKHPFVFVICKLCSENDKNKLSSEWEYSIKEKMKIARKYPQINRALIMDYVNALKYETSNEVASFTILNEDKDGNRELRNKSIIRYFFYNELAGRHNLYDDQVNSESNNRKLGGDDYFLDYKFYCSYSDDDYIK